MYIEYYTPQYKVFPELEYTCGELPMLTPDHTSDLNTYNDDISDNDDEELFATAARKESKFKPTWLLRVSDMEVIPGKDIREGYYTLSYSWNQSGDIIENDQQQDTKYTRLDKGHHYIAGFEPPTVTFEKLIQKICQDFGIRYIWYDQLCINQEDPEEKAREIRQMHKIYSHAQCTLALVPELMRGSRRPNSPMYAANIEQLPNAEWSKRIWTLQEAYLSKRILFIGTNLYLWSPDIEKPNVLVDQHSSFLYNLCVKPVAWSPSTVLYYARRRTSTKPHDMIFALVSMFPSTLEAIVIDYEQPILDLAIQFYTLLATQDLSVLLFGAAYDTSSHGHNGEIIHQPWEESLPSWTGVAGVHIPQVLKEEGDDGASCRNTPPIYSYSFCGNSLIISSHYIPVSIECTVSLSKSSFASPVPPHANTKKWMPHHSIVTSVSYGYAEYNPGGYSVTSSPVSQEQQLRFVRVLSAEGIDVYNRNTQYYGLKATHILPVRKDYSDSSLWINSVSAPRAVGGWLSLTEEDCSECFVLAGIGYSLNIGEEVVCMPVIAKSGGHYKAIGVCLREKDVTFCPSLELPEKEFVIK